MRLLNKEIEKRLTVKLNKSIKTNDVTGIMDYGKFNDYPQVIEKLIFGSQTAKACANIYAKFIGGNGFENEAIGKIEVGVDNKGKPITLDNIRRQIADSLAKFNGAYIHCNQNFDKQVGNTRLVPFKDCRLSKEDDRGYCAKIAVHPNWSKESDLKKFDKNQISWFNHFNLKTIETNIGAAGGIEKYKGQIYSLYLDDNYLYPLSPFDSVYLDMDTEYQIQLFKNREIRNGFTDKIVMNIAPPKEEKEREETVNKAKSWMGADGDKLLMFESEFDENGDLKENGSFKVQEIKTNINDKLFEGWEKSLANNIRKAIHALPAVLIDYEQGQLSQASGEMVIQATNYYNALTQPLRDAVSEMIKDIYSNHIDPALSSNTDWSLRPTSLITTEVKDDALNEKIKSQAVLRGSVGGVTALIALQQAVSQGSSDVEAAVATVVEIYGINEDTARRMIGIPKPSNPTNYVNPKL